MSISSEIDFLKNLKKKTSLLRWHFWYSTKFLIHIFVWWKGLSRILSGSIKKIRFAGDSEEHIFSETDTEQSHEEIGATPRI